MSDIKPALTPEEWGPQVNDWARMGRPPLPQMVTEYWVELAIRDRVTSPEERNHAMAAMCLYGQPFGFTWEHHDALLRAADGATFHDRDLALEAAGRVAALLPPRQP